MVNLKDIIISILVWVEEEVAQKYTQALQNKDLITPYQNPDTTSAWAQYSVRVKDRDALQIKLKEKGVPTAVHYPMPLHLQECFDYLGYDKGNFPISERVSEEIMSNKKTANSFKTTRSRIYSYIKGSNGRV